MSEERSRRAARSANAASTTPTKSVITGNQKSARDE